MSTTHTVRPDEPPVTALEPTAAPPGIWKTPVLFGVFAVLIALLPLLKPRAGDTTFRLAVDSDFAKLPELTAPSDTITWVTVVLMLVAAGYAAWCARSGRRTPLWLVALYGVAAMTGFLAWAAADETVPVIGLLAGALALAVPLVFGALGGVLGERAGVVNIAIDGQLLFGAFGAALIGSVTGSPWIALLAAMFAGALVALVLGVFAITYYVDQVIVGVVLNVLVIGITSFMFSQVLAPNAATLNSPPRFERIPIPLLGDIPIVGPILFRQTILVYLMYVAVAVISWALYRTRWGLRVRAVGEHPMAADTVGIKVNLTRYRTVLLAVRENQRIKESEKHI